jgi:hypothetical protein
VLIVSSGVPGVSYQGSMLCSRLAWSGLAAHMASQKASQGTACRTQQQELSTVSGHMRVCGSAVQ